MRRTRTFFGWFCRDDSGAVFTLGVLTWIAITSLSATVIVGGSQVAADVANKQDTDAAAANLRGGAEAIREKMSGRDDEYAQQMLENANKMEQVAGKMESDANWAIAKSGGSVAVDLALAPVQMDKLSKLGKAGKFLWDFKGGVELGQSGMSAVQDVPPEIGQLQQDLAAIQFNKKKPPSDPTAPELPTIPDYELPDPTEGYILGVKVKSATQQLQGTLPDREDDLYEQLAMDLVKDMETDELIGLTEASSITGEIEWGDAPFADALAAEVSLLDPGNAPTVEMGGVQLTDADRAALESGEKTQVIGQYYGTAGMEPVVVTRDDAGGLTTEFTLLEGQPAVSTSPDYKPDYEEMPDWWDGTVDSCPYVYAWDGRSFVAVNDIISVSRDPVREYDDFMLFRSLAQPDGTLEVRVAEVRTEESFLDRIVMKGVVPDDGFGAVVTPSGDVLSVRDPVGPDRARAAAPSALAAVDGTGVKLYSGSRFEASWSVGDAGDAVMLLAMDGFEDLGDMGLPLFQRPAVTVEAYVEGAWRPAGTIFPREQLDEMALDVSRFIDEGTVRLRFSATSCHVEKFQFVDAVRLSTAPTDRVTVRALDPIGITLDGRDVSAELASTDGLRVHTVPGDVIRFRYAGVSTTLFVAESRGWYRDLE